jgi:enamine deaminase RidA (YjgF/YER057c/UK114 family)
MDDFSAMNKTYQSFFEGDLPARATVQAAGLPLGAAVEIEAIALVE